MPLSTTSVPVLRAVLRNVRISGSLKDSRLPCSEAFAIGGRIVLSGAEDHEESADGDRDPQQHAENQRTRADGGEVLPRQPRADEEERHGEADARERHDVVEPWLVRPSGGKRKSAIEVRMKIVPSDTDSSSSVAPTTGPTAAIALPPQIAVPEAMRCAVVWLTRSARPARKPSTSVIAIVAAVQAMP